MRALVAALVLVGAAVVAHVTTPTREERVAPFVVDAAVGEWGQARAFGAEVEDVVLAEQVTDGDWVGTTGGVWVVVTVTAEAALEPGTVSATLLVGDLRFDASDRAGSSALSATTLSPGLAQRGDLLFELPVQALRDHGDDLRLRLAERPVPRLDSVVDVPLEVAGLEPVPVQELTVVERTVR